MQKGQKTIPEFICKTIVKVSQSWYINLICWLNLGHMEVRMVQLALVVALVGHMVVHMEHLVALAFALAWQLAQTWKQHHRNTMGRSLEHKQISGPFWLVWLVGELVQLRPVGFEETEVLELGVFLDSSLAGKMKGKVMLVEY